jgi:hypothetical protein
MTAGALAGLIALVDFYFRNRRLGFPPTVSTLQTVLALFAITAGVLALGRRLEHCAPEQAQNRPNAIALVGIGLGVLACLIPQFVPRLNY